MSNQNANKLNDKIKYLEQQKKVLEYKIVNENRRERTRRLIQKGALLEKYLEEGNANNSLNDTENLLKILAFFKSKNNEYINRLIKNIEEDPSALSKMQ